MKHDPKGQTIEEFGDTLNWVMQVGRLFCIDGIDKVTIVFDLNGMSISNFVTLW